MARASAARHTRVDRRTRTARAEGRDGRAELLAAARAVFAERGYRDASVDEIADRAGYSKGAVYWHFSSKDGLFLALLDEAIDRPWRETIALLATTDPDHDMVPETNARFAELLRAERDLLLLEHEYWAQAARDPRLARRYRKRRRELRSALGRALIARLEHLGAPPLDAEGAERMASAFIGLAAGLAREQLVDPDAVPDDLLGESFALIYAGHVARHQREPNSPD